MFPGIGGHGLLFSRSSSVRIDSSSQALREGTGLQLHVDSSFQQVDLSIAYMRY